MKKIMKKTATAKRSFVLHREVNNNKKLIILESVLALVSLGLIINLYIQMNSLSAQLAASLL